MIDQGPWQRVTQPDGSVYYYNQATQESTWALPAGVVDETPANKPPAAAAAAQEEQGPPTGSATDGYWVLVPPEDGGRPYYQHQATGETAWEKPAMSVEDEFEIPSEASSVDSSEDELPELEHDEPGQVEWIGDEEAPGPQPGG